jgi:hypothetical protein
MHRYQRSEQNRRHPGRAAINRRQDRLLRRELQDKAAIDVNCTALHRSPSNLDRNAGA